MVEYDDGGAAESQVVPIEAVPLLMQIISQPEHPNRDEALGMLADLVSASFGENGRLLGEAMRETGGLITLSWMLSDADLQRLQIALFLLANLASDAVDPDSEKTKNMLLQCGTEYRLIPCMNHEDIEVVTYTLAFVQNLCHDFEWTKVFLDRGVEAMLVELIKE